VHRPGSAQAAGETIRLLRRSDLDRAEQLSRRVGFNQTAADWSRLLDLGPDSCFAALREDGVVATTTTTVYSPRLAWIGMVVVDLSARRQGIARRLVDHALRHLEAGGVETAALDATPQGKQVYDRFGFVDQYEIHRLQGPAAPVDPGAVAAARPMTEADLPEVVRMDAAGLGVTRTALLHALFRAAPDGCSVVEGDDGLDAWSFRRPGAARWHIGPVAARHEEAAHVAVEAAMAGIPGAPLEIDVIDGPGCGRLAARFGLSVARSFVRMARGASLPDPGPAGCIATAAPELG
jgi:ribosomal protein S18 acetylase RimI-like enzyme